MSKADNTQAELRNLLGELQNRTVSAFTSRRYDEQNILRDEYQEAISVYISKQIEAVLDRAFQKMIPDEGVDEATKGTFADGYSKAVEDVCNNFYSLRKELDGEELTHE